MVALTLVMTLLLTLTNTAVADAGDWLPPLPTIAVARDFGFDARTPFSAGGRRGVRLAGDPGQTVRAPCSGRVRFAGRVPRLGRGVSLRCGRLAATEFGLQRLRVRRGDVVIAGAPVGQLGSRGRLFLGARVASERWGYRDPLGLLAGVAVRPLGPAPLPLRVRVRTPALPPPASPAPIATAAASPPLPLAAWVGAGVAGIGAGLGVTLRRRPRRGRARRAEVPTTHP